MPSSISAQYALAVDCIAKIIDCPCDHFDHEFDDCATVCGERPRSECWKKYFAEQAKGRGEQS